VETVPSRPGRVAPGRVTRRGHLATTPPRIRLVATDLDGTIVRSDGTISDRTVKSLARAEEAGAAVVLVTGRPPRWIGPVAEATGHRGMVICSNGGIIYDLHDERIIESFLIPAATVAQVVDILRTALPDLSFAVETGEDVYRGPGYRSGWVANPDPETTSQPIEEITAYSAAKLLASHPSMDVDELLRCTRDLVCHLVEPTHSNGRGLLEMGALGVSKATTLARFAGELGVGPSEVVAFGDMPNDLPMLAWAGTAYAVANAHPLVLAAVDRTTASNDDDGVARVLEELFGAE
jgi:Cof subfamily protein (haloacid dehalogenase superfamily)